VSSTSVETRVTMLVRNGYTNDTRVEREARTLADAGHHVTVVAEASPGRPARERGTGIDVVRIARSGPRIPGYRLLAHERHLRLALRETRPDILHAHDTDALGVVGPVADRLRIPFVFDSHELWLGRSSRGHGALYHRLAMAYYGRIERRWIPSAAAVMVANPPVAPFLARRYGLTRVEEVPNYPAEREVVEARDVRGLARGADIPRDAAIVMYVGGIGPERGIETLVEAMSQVPDAHLVFLGGGGLESEIRHRVAECGIADRTHFLGMVPSDDVVPYAASATVGILSTVPTSQNNRLALPNKIFQYMAASVPVVASDFPQIRDVVVGSEAGVVYDPTDVEDLARAIRGYTEDPALASRHGANGRRAISETYHWDVSAARLLDIYRRVSDTGYRP